jgi:hypothetical protein
MSALGPTIIFDKSSLQSLSEDESVWLDAFYHSIITPLFYVETLADLTKKIESKTPEDIVRIIANKVPEMGSSPTMHHRELSIGNLLGYEVSLSRRPILSGGKSYTLNNKRGVIFDEHPELQAFERWRKQDFLEIEKGIASLWRKSLAEFDYDHFLNLIQIILGSDFKKPKSLEDSYDFATKIIKGQGHRYKTLQLFRDLISINDEAFKKIVSIWNQKGMVPIENYAPYAAHVLKIDIFFILCTSSGLISRDRKSNRADIAYLYYLPFANIFTSGDKLHKRIVPLFMEPDQRFISGEDLKKDLLNLDQYFDKLKSKEEKQDGVYSFAWYPPDDDKFLTTVMWDSLRPNWRLNNNSLNNENSSQEQKIPDGLKEHIKKAHQEIKNTKKQDIPSGFDLETASDVILKRTVRGRKGKWKLFSNEIMNSKEKLMEDDT